jgi:hypothetical protein
MFSSQPRLRVQFLKPVLLGVANACRQRTRGAAAYALQYEAEGPAIAGTLRRPSTGRSVL